MHTPFFPLWRSRLAAYGRRTRRCRCAAEIRGEFARFLPHGLLNRAPSGAGSRDRIYGRQNTFWCFLWQALQPLTACRAVVRKMQAEGERERRPIDGSSSAYCQARARLPLPLLDQAVQHSAQSADRMAHDRIPGWDRPVKVVDATSFQTPDTLANRRRYHYPKGPKRGCGFPVVRALAIFSLAGGAIHHIVTAACYTAELVMFKPLWACLRCGDILLGDRAYGCFPLLAALSLRGVDVIARLHQGRQMNLRMAEKMGPNEWITTWHRAYNVPPYLKTKEWKTFPQNIRVRIIRSSLNIKGFRTRTIWLVTTLTDAVRYPYEAIIQLYLRRWHMEISFRDLKTTLGMESLRCRSPRMIEKEIRMHLIAHNCLRALMAEAAVVHGVPRERISFKGTMDTLRSFHSVLLRATSNRRFKHLRSRLLEILANDRLPLRPGRSEPRAVKKRPKPYPFLTKHRHVFRELPHRGNPTASKRPQVILT